VARVRIIWNRAEIYATATKPAISLVRRAARQTSSRAKFYAPVDTGRLRSSIGEFGFTVSRDSVRIFVGTTRIRYAMAQHEGARARTIVPRRARALRFYWDVTGRIEFFRSVQWPGIGGTPFLTTGMREACVPLGFAVSTIRTVDLA
jgi:hypothetical protein